MRHGDTKGNGAAGPAAHRHSTRTLLRTLEEPCVDRLAEDVPLHGRHDGRAGLLLVGAGGHVDRRVERVQLERVVVLRTGVTGAGAGVDLPRRADLTAAVGAPRTLRRGL